MSTEVSLTTIAICQLVAAVAAIVLAVGLLYAAFSLKRLVSRKIDQALAEVRPVAEQARSIAERAARTADSAADKVDSIMTAAEDAATDAGNAVRNVSRKMEEALNPQIVNVAALVAAIVKCI
ncbi:MAG: hypothetical protein ACP5R5_13175, partial [Armatimonadota bacterium]